MFGLTKSLSQDFPGGLTHHHLVRELVDAGLTNCKDIYQEGDVITINFSSDYTADLTAINSVISGYVRVPAFFDDLKFVSAAAADSPFSVTSKSVKCDSSAGNISVLLPKSQRVKNGVFAIQKTSAGGVVTITPNGAETINGGASMQLTTLKSYVVLRTDGSNWTTIGGDRADTSANSALGAASSVGDILVDDGNELSPLHVGGNGTVLIADSTRPLGVRWGSVTGGGSSVCTEVSSLTTTSTVSTAYVLIAGMTTTPVAGSYLVMFSASGSTSSSSANINYAVFVGGVVVASSERLLRSATSTTMGLYTQAKVTVNGSQAIEIRYKTSTGTFTVNVRNICLVGVQ